MAEEVARIDLESDEIVQVGGDAACSFRLIRSYLAYNPQFEQCFLSY